MFYKMTQTGDLIEGNRVFGPDFRLLPALHADYTYPVDGWVWYDTRAEAETAFGTEIIDDAEVWLRDKIENNAMVGYIVTHTAAERKEYIISNINTLNEAKKKLILLSNVIAQIEKHMQ